MDQENPNRAVIWEDFSDFQSYMRDHPPHCHNSKCGKSITDYKEASYWKVYFICPICKYYTVAHGYPSGTINYYSGQYGGVVFY